MRRAWALLRLSMQPFARPAFADCLRQAWAEAKAAPVTPLDRLQRASAGIGAITAGMARDEVIRRLEGALTVARSRAAQYSRAGAPRNWSEGKHRSAETLPVSRTPAHQCTALAMLTAKRSGACRRDIPPSTAATTRSRRSKESVLAIHACLPLRQGA